jgi:hypothetical protein
MASSSRAMIPRGTREVTIAPTWDVSTGETSTDVEMTGMPSHAFTVPEFVASAVDSIQSQIRYLSAKLDDTTEMARVSEA